ncbi:MAG: Rrf2 family transcriptional regulator [Clostridiales Family XIII bacterium]|nr:Rrf2 family transcriptional regulator [Clostridiales Family XIII bacterium]
MIITRETDYALRILRALKDGTKKSLPTICEREHVPKQFGYKILKKLSTANLVEIRRGKDGGYILTADLGKLSIYDIVELMESGTPVTACVNDEYTCTYRKEHNGHCHFHNAMRELQDSIDEKLKSITLLDMVK